MKIEKSRVRKVAVAALLVAAVSFSGMALAKVKGMGFQLGPRGKGGGQGMALQAWCRQNTDECNRQREEMRLKREEVQRLCAEKSSDCKSKREEMRSLAKAHKDKIEAWCIQNPDECKNVNPGKGGKAGKKGNAGNGQKLQMLKQRCKQNPQQCKQLKKQVQDRRQWCKNNPDECNAQRAQAQQKRLEFKKWCDSNSADCKAKKQEWKKKAADVMKSCKGDPGTCAAKKQALIEQLEKEGAPVPAALKQ